MQPPSPSYFPQNNPLQGTPFAGGDVINNLPNNGQPVMHIDNWWINHEGCIVAENGRTSPVISWNKTLVVTSSNKVYSLGQLHPRILDVCRQNNFTIDESDPLKDATTIIRANEVLSCEEEYKRIVSDLALITQKFHIDSPEHRCFPFVKLIENNLNSLFQMKLGIDQTNLQPSEFTVNQQQPPPPQPQFQIPIAQTIPTSIPTPTPIPVSVPFQPLSNPSEAEVKLESQNIPDNTVSVAQETIQQPITTQTITPTSSVPIEIPSQQEPAKTENVEEKQEEDKNEEDGEDEQDKNDDEDGDEDKDEEEEDKDEDEEEEDEC